MKTKKLLDFYQNKKECRNLENKIVASHKRTIYINEVYNYKPSLICKNIIQFPKSLFIHYDYESDLWGKCYSAMAFAINEDDEVCHQPFFNIDEIGRVCMATEDKKSLNKFVENFYTQPFKVCYDCFGDSIRKYQVNALSTNDIKHFYKNFDQKLIPIHIKTK
jgi:hypothetical protein